MEYKSKTKKKKEALSLQVLGERLVKLPKEQINDIDLPVEIYDAVIFAKTIKQFGALRRQMQYIGTLMRKIDPAPVQEALFNIEQGNYKKAAEFKATEKLRDELISGKNRLIEKIIIKCPDADRQQLTLLARNARKEKENNKPPKAFRALFSYLIKIKAGRSDL
jgi:ribosome-associated protein